MMMTKPLTPFVSAGRAAAVPVVLDGTVGLYQPETRDMARRDVVVLMISPWGYEEMCIRKSFRLLSEKLADHGIASFRFDYHGTGDSIVEADRISGLSDWQEQTVKAAEKLAEISQCRKIILVGQGVGALIAQRVASRIDGVVSVVLLAPITSGRLYLREVDIWARMIYTDLGVGGMAQPQGQVSIAGLVLPETVASDLRKINVLQDDQPLSGPFVVFERTNRPSDHDLSLRLAELGAQVEIRPYEGYEHLVTMPLTAREPIEVMDGIVEHACAKGELSPQMPPSKIPETPGQLEGDGFIEIPVRFGRFNHLSGILCRPADAITGRSVVILGTAYDRHSGWGRSIAAMSRQLARNGSASLRFDAANVGDSPPKPGDPDHVLYSQTQNEDAVAAFDFMERAVDAPFVVAGRCSGAYLGLRVAVDDPRPKGMVGVNPYVFYWDAAHPVSTDVSIIPRSLDDYGKRLASFQTVRRILAGEVNLKAAARNFTVALWRRMTHRFAAIFRWLPSDRSITVEVNRTFRTLRDRGTPYRLIYCEGDVGLDHLYRQFGSRGRNLGNYSNVQLEFLTGADHNLTPPHAREAFFKAVSEMARP